jgi:hypothetical protein
MLTTTTWRNATAATTRFRAIAAYLAFRAIPLDPQAVLSHFERSGTTEGLLAVEDDFYALLDRFAERVCDDVLPTRPQQRQATCLVREALATLVERIETGRIDGRAAQLGDRGCGCILVILADIIDALAWRTLREDEDEPLLIERFVWHVLPGETHRTCPTLALVREWTLCSLG